MSTVGRSNGVRFLWFVLLCATETTSSIACSSSPGATATRDAGTEDAKQDGRPNVGGTGGTTTVGMSAAPRLIAPVSTATVTSRRPKLRWVLASGTDAAHVQICHDRACATEVTSFDATGSSGAPAADLPPGILFWRAYGQNGGVTGQAVTPTWEFTVGALSAPVNTSWGTTMDVNGDGYADVVVGAMFTNMNTGEAYVFMGSASGLSPSAAVTLLGSDKGDEFGWSVASAGDVNGDGYSDVIVGAPQARRAYVYLGGPAGLSSSPVLTLITPGSSTGTFGIAVSSVGDVNGDGYGDVVVSDPVDGFAYVYFGSAGGLSSSPSADFQGSFVAGSVTSAGDINGDGYADIIGGAYDTGNSGIVYIFLGSPSGPSFIPSTTLGPGNTGDEFGVSAAGAGDINGDGYADVVIGAPDVNGSQGAAYVYLGSASGLSSSPSITLAGPGGTNGDFGNSVASAGDVNGDGYADVVVGADEVNNVDGAAYVFLGGQAGLSTIPVVTLAGPQGAQATFGGPVAGVGDVDGDGYADLVIGALNYNSGDGAAYLYLGTASGPSASASLTLHPTNPQGIFGTSIARADGIGDGFRLVLAMPATILTVCSRSRGVTLCDQTVPG
jgi:hypothetical protein